MSIHTFSRRALFAASAAAVGVALAGCTSGAAGSKAEARAKATISSVTPDRGGVSGGARVEIAGTGLAEDTVVTFGSVPATVVSATGDRLTVIAPAAKHFGVGRVDIRVAEKAGANPTAGARTYRYAVSSPVDKQMAYALAHWSAATYNTAEWGDLNPVGGDCANFVSQTLIARGWRMDSAWYNHDAGASWSPAWGYVPAMDVYLAKNAGRLGLKKISLDQSDRSKIALGDVAIFDWNDNDSPDHVQVVDKIVHNADGTIAISMASHNDDFAYRDLDHLITVEHPGAVGHFWHLTR